jgi:hypothetical protein
VVTTPPPGVVAGDVVVDPADVVVVTDGIVVVDGAVVGLVDGVTARAPFDEPVDVLGAGRALQPARASATNPSKNRRYMNCLLQSALPLRRIALRDLRPREIRCGSDR